MSAMPPLPLDIAAFARAVVPVSLSIRAIAAALAHEVRFAGKLKGVHYSVAQHSLLVADQLADRPVDALYGLLHDAHEAVLGDVPTVFSAYIALASGVDWIGRIKANLDAVILPGLGLDWPVPKPIAERIAYADQRAFVTELRDVAQPLAYAHDVQARPLTGVIHGWPWPKAEEKFVEAWRKYSALTGYVPGSPRRGRGA